MKRPITKEDANDVLVILIIICVLILASLNIYQWLVGFFD